MSERTLRGIGVSPGVAYGPALVVDWRFPDVPDRGIGPDQLEAEIARLHDAVEIVVQHLEALRERVRERAGPEESNIFEAQILMARDPEFLSACEHLIRKNLLSAETAYEFKALETRVSWSGTSNVRLRERLADLSAVQIRCCGCWSAIAMMSSRSPSPTGRSSSWRTSCRRDSRSTDRDRLPGW
jgi:phosphotransferase system enzyme I (PtsI)